MKKYLLIGLFVLAAAAGIFFYLKENSKPALAKAIKSMGGTSGNVESFDKGFLKAWKKGLENGQIKFEYKGSNYNTAGGKKTT